MSNSKSDLLNLLVLPALQRKIVVYLTREGPADTQALCQALDQDSTEVRQALAILVQKGHVKISADGLADVNLGRTRRRTLPARLWPALLATSRLYSVQEIAALQTAVPILQFARAKLSEFVDHGPNHVLRVKSFATQLSYILALTPKEQHLLRAAALFHDIGNVVERERHHIVSQETVEKLAAAGQLPFSAREASLVGLLCRWHRKEYKPAQRDKLHGQTIRTGLLASILRVADAMDIDRRRSDYGDQFSWVRQFFFPDQLPHWASLEEIFGVRIYCAPAVKLQVFSQGQTADNIQIEMLRQDVNGIPLDWSVQHVVISDSTEKVSTSAASKKVGKALLAFPFDPHSLVMAALSGRHLETAGYKVELLCYPDAADGSAWLWGQALTEIDPTNFVRLIVIGDRPDPTLHANLFTTIDRYLAAGVSISLLNRHEANWTRLPELLQRGVEVILGGDWAYFWGDEVSGADLSWGRIAALCTRDSTLSTVGLTVEEQALTQGLLKVVYDAAGQPAASIEDWVALAKPILNRIGQNDQAYFAGLADSFVDTYISTSPSNQVQGRVLRFETWPDDTPQAAYWAMEAAIERYGRTFDRGICFNTPYAIATWVDADAIMLLAINHWRDEAALPIRLLYPADLGPPPEGNETTIQVRLPPDQAEAVVQALIKACNNQAGLSTVTK